MHSETCLGPSLKHQAELMLLQEFHLFLFLHLEGKTKAPLTRISSDSVICSK